jgi:hypothetical protein
MIGAKAGVDPGGRGGRTPLLRLEVTRAIYILVQHYSRMLCGNTESGVALK